MFAFSSKSMSFDLTLSLVSTMVAVEVHLLGDTTILFLLCLIESALPTAVS